MIHEQISNYISPDKCFRGYGFGSITTKQLINQFVNWLAMKSEKGSFFCCREFQTSSGRILWEGIFSVIRLIKVAQYGISHARGPFGWVFDGNNGIKWILNKNSMIYRAGRNWLKEKKISSKNIKNSKSDFHMEEKEMSEIFYSLKCGNGNLKRHAMFSVLDWV